MNNRFYGELILLLITCLVALPLQFIPKLKENKKVNEYSTHSEPHRPTLRATYSII